MRTVSVGSTQLSFPEELWERAKQYARDLRKKVSAKEEPTVTTKTVRSVLMVTGEHVVAVADALDEDLLKDVRMRIAQKANRVQTPIIDRERQRYVDHSIELAQR